VEISVLEVDRYFLSNSGLEIGGRILHFVSFMSTFTVYQTVFKKGLLKDVNPSTDAGYFCWHVLKNQLGVKKERSTLKQSKI
jgi:hypothetical protein